jgi:methyl-accepting chemotaxis protein
MLKSNEMSLSPAERGWLPWFGALGKLAMGWSTFLNRDRYPAIEMVFEGIAVTRVELLHTWAEQLWNHLAALGQQLEVTFPQIDPASLRLTQGVAEDFSEVFVIDTTGQLLDSTAAGRSGPSQIPPKALQAALKGPFLHGPYCDPVTEKLGRSSSRFHDEVTLMFYQPLRRDGRVIGLLCGRVPNDVMGDLIQREAGHVFPESGDNYLFMVKSHFDPAVAPGTALSRSRFEDATFTHGDNLKDGVRTDYGTVRIAKHTELELCFNDPATGQLHPGVRETIRKGENLFVTYPGYSDYRHIPVIGKGVTLRLPHSPDSWGMMCEGDLEEVYRYRSIAFKLTRLYLTTSLAGWIIATAIEWLADMGRGWSLALSLGFTLLGAKLFQRIGARPMSQRLRETTRLVRAIAEGGGNLTQRLPRKTGNDETTFIGLWVNSFIDNLELIIRRVVRTSREIRQTNQAMLDNNQHSHRATTAMMTTMQGVLDAIRHQIAEIDQASSNAEEMRAAMQQISSAAAQQFAMVQLRTGQIRSSVEASTQTIRSLETSTLEIGRIVTVISEIANQTNLLALNAAIEAARAGESGRGFAVVADEVRKLAERTAGATGDIRAMIANVQTQAQDAVSRMESGMSQMEEGVRLAAETAADRGEMQGITERMFSAIEQIATDAHALSRQVSSITGSADAVRTALTAAGRSAQVTEASAAKLNLLVGQFQVAEA